MLSDKRIKKAIEKLDSPDPSARKEAVEALSQGDERAIYPLIKMLRDENPGVQDATIRSLISIGLEMQAINAAPVEKGVIDKASASGEETLHHDRGRFLTLPQGEVVAYMILPLLREDSYLRNTALIILGELGQVAVPLLYPLLQDKDDDVRKFSLDLLGKIRTSVSPEKVMGLLRDPNPNVRSSAAKVISTLQYREGVPRLIECLNDEEWVCFSVLETLGELKDERAVGPVAGLLSEPSDLLRCAAIEALGKLESPLGIGPLKKFLSENGGFERIMAIKSLLQIGITPDMTDLSDILLEMLASDEQDDRFLALKGLVTLGNQRAVPAMIELAGSLDPSSPENEDILWKIEDALIQLHPESMLLDLVKNETVRYRGKTMAIRVLGKIRSRRSVPVLQEMLKSTCRDLRKEGASALGDIVATEAMPSLLDTIEDADGQVRKAAVIALGKIEEPSAYRPLLELLEREKYGDIQEEIIDAILHINPSGFTKNLDSL